jgi:hypothetical protein
MRMDDAMVVSYGDMDIAVGRWSSVGEARAAIGEGMCIAEEFGSGSGPVYSFVLTPATGSAGEARTVFGIQMDTEYEIPYLLGSEWGSARWIGCNSQVYRVVTGMVAPGEIPLQSRFMGFHLREDLGRLFVLSESALLALEETGEVLWRVDVDLIATVEWSGSTAILNQMDGPRVRVNLLDGKAGPDSTSLV